MASTITDRVSVVVSGGAVAAGGLGIIQVTGVAGTNDLTGDCSPAISGYVTNQYFSFRPANINTGAMTVNWASRGQVALLNPSGGALTAGQVDPVYEYLIRYNGSNFRIVSPSF